MSGGRDRDRFELLAAAAEVADGTLSLAETVQRLLEIVVPAFADVATLDVVDPSGDLRRLGARLGSPRSSELERALAGRRQVKDPTVGVGRTISSGQSQLLSPILDHQLRAIAGRAADLELLRALRLRSTIYVPLRARGRTVGALACSVGDSGRRYDEDDLRFAEVLSGRIALALDNAGLSEMLSGLERRLEAALANLAEAVLVRDPGGRVVFANPAAARLLGVESVNALSSLDPSALMAKYDVSDEHGRRVGLEDLPSTRAAAGERAEPLLVRNIIRATGEERWLLHKATPVFDPEGTLSMVVSVIENVTEVKRAELAQRLLADAGRVLSSSLDYEQTLQRVAQLAVPALADWCGVTIREGDVLRQVAVAHSDPAKVALAREFGERYPARMSDASGAAEVIRSGQAQLVPLITEELLEGAELSGEQLALVRELQMRSVIIVPLAIPGRSPIGAVSLVMAESGRRFGRDELSLAEELGRRAATSVENARLYTERSRIASALQQSLLPPQLPEVPGFRLATLYRPAGDHSEVGGDFYDAFEVPGGWMVVVGDVEGRGAEAAALTSLSRYTLRTAGKLLGDPVAALAQLNAALRERPRLSLVTVCCALLREGPQAADCDVVLAGHPPAYHIHAGRPREVGVLAPLLGAYESGTWEPAAITLEPGDQLVLYTDGVIDTVGESERFGEARLAAALRGATGAADAVARVEQSIRRFAHGPQADDTAVAAVERVGGKREGEKREGEPGAAAVRGGGAAWVC
ncbi:MAG: SpoIIE family protein phosphatase [Solirubrobacterales bacterium]|nr:SpoIIE family protein phosphatase [Solirubrobacterales bacterium]MBV9715154.1 SpoIIE family protein phosphatase [Solirubrobacterales bacterium]